MAKTLVLEMSLCEFESRRLYQFFGVMMLIGSIEVLQTFCKGSNPFRSIILRSCDAIGRHLSLRTIVLQVQILPRVLFDLGFRISDLGLILSNDFRFNHKIFRSRSSIWQRRWFQKPKVVSSNLTVSIFQFRFSARVAKRQTQEI